MTCHAIKNRILKECVRDGGEREREAYDYAEIPCSVLLLRNSASLPELVPLQIRVTESEQGQVGRTTVGHLVQPPCSGKAIMEHRAQTCVQMELLESASTDERWTDPSVSTASTKEPLSLYFHGS